MQHYDYLIVGGGMTAQAAVTGIREVDGTGRIGVISAEHHPPYRRPPLSKGLWNGTDRTGIWYDPPGVGVDLHLECSVVGLDPVEKRVRNQVGREFSFGKLLLATGAAPRRLAHTPDADVIYFRTFDDYLQLRSLAEQPLRVVVIGGGFIGTEIAAALNKRGHRVAMLVPEKGLGGRLFPADLSRYLAKYYRERGVDVWTGERVARVTRKRDAKVVHTVGGGTLEADVVVAGLGVEPNVDLALGAQLSVDDGILVNEYLQTSRPDIFAAGDVATIFSPALEAHCRFEHEDNALTMGAAAGRNMTGELAAYRHLPFFYSDLFDLGYEAVGDLDAWYETVCHWEIPFEQGVVYYVNDGRVRGVLLWNTWGKVDAARKLIEDQLPIDAALEASVFGLAHAQVS